MATSPAPQLPYYPRPELVESIEKILNSGLTDAVTMFAARRMGKTEFAKRDLIPAAENWGWQCVYVDLWRRKDEPELALVEALEEHLRDHQAARVRRPNRVTAKAGVSGLGVEAEWSGQGGSTESADLAQRLRAALIALVGDGSRITLLVLDEFQTLAAGKHASFVAAFRAVGQVKAQDVSRMRSKP